MFHLLKGAYARWVDDRAARLAAALAYYAAFSFAPLFLIAAGLGTLAVGDPELRGKLVGQSAMILGPNGADMLGQLVQDSKWSPASGVFSAITGFLALVLAGVGLLAQLKDALNSVWDVKLPEQSSWVDWIKRYLANIALVVATGFLLMVSLVVTAAIAGLTEHARVSMSGSAPLFFALDLVVGLIVTTIGFALIFRVIPDAPVKWRDAWVGGAFTAVLFTAGRLLLGVYLGLKSGDSVSGSAGAILALLLWVYYSAQLVLFGAEFTFVYSRRHEPKEA